MKIIFAWFLILCFAIILRFYNISSLPPSLNWDEVSIGYNAYSIFKTGMDEWGNSFPLSFRAFGDYKLPVYIYLDVPFIAVFGLNEMGVRLPSVLAGIGIVILIFFILKEITKNIKTALLGMLLAAILPWLIIFSRIGLEANLALFLTILTFYFLVLSLRKKYFLPISAVFLGMSLFTYNSSRVLFFPFIFLVAVFYGKDILRRKKEFLAATIITSVFAIFAFSQAFFIDSNARYKWTTILDEGAVSSINQERQLSNFPPIIEKLFYNKATYFLVNASKNYISNFNPEFLFINGGSNYQFSVPGSGLAYWILLPLILFGILQTILQRKRWQFFIFFWLLISPLPSAITRDAPHALRSIFMIVPLLILSVQGVDIMKQLLKIRLFQISLVVLITILLINTYLFWQNYSGDYLKNYSWSWQYGYKEAISYMQENYSKYQKIVITKKYGEPHEFLLFYTGYNPSSYIFDPGLSRYERSSWFWVDGFDKYQFINDWEIKEKLSYELSSNSKERGFELLSKDNKRNILLVTSPGNYPSQGRVIQSINFKDGKKAFDIVVLD